METSSHSLVSKARTAFHSAAAKAEKVLTDIKADLKTDHQEDSEVKSLKSPRSQSEPEKIDRECEQNELKHSRWKPPHLGRNQDWHNRLKNIRRKKVAQVEVDVVEREKYLNLSVDVLDGDEISEQLQLGDVPQVKELEKESPTKEENLNALNMPCIPSASVIKQLAIAVESGKKCKSMNDLLASARSSSPIRERAGLSFSAMKSLVLRDKDEKGTSEFSNDDEILSASRNLFDAERHTSKWQNCSGSVASLPRDIHGAPPDCFVVGLSHIIGSFKTLRKMALFWYKVVAELRRLWSEGQPVPCVPLDENPDLNSCLLHQQLQVINCCISRKERRAVASESLNSIMVDAGSSSGDLVLSPSLGSSTSLLYARVNSGDLILRLGADHLFENLTMLETGEAVYCPITQEGPILTEDLIRENEEFVLRTGSVGAGCSQLLSDMQAFKAANPGCILEDFVRWHSPPDWKSCDPSDEVDDSFDLGDPSSKRGQLSTRMQKEGNLWRELWETAKPVPAVNQIPLYDEDLAVDGILNNLEEITPFELFQQLFVSLLGSGFVAAEGILPTNSDLSKLFYECKDYIIATCQGKTWSDNIDDLCQVYETVETMIVNPEDCLKIMSQSEETATVDEPKRRFKKLNLNFVGKDRPFLRKPYSIFSKKPPKSDSIPSNSEESDWTIV